MNENSDLKRLLILDDDVDFRKLTRTYLGKVFEGVELNEYDPVADGIPDQDFDWSKYDMLLLDYNLCIVGTTGLDILQNNRNNELFPATIMLTAAGNEEIAVRALKSGVYDYIRKDHLDKNKLRNSILDAWEKHRSERERLNELTIQSHAFNKALFYQQLEQSFKEETDKNRALILISLDDHETLEQQSGIIMRDNIIRHIARRSFDFFKLSESNPCITRFSEDSVALITDAPEADVDLESNIENIRAYLKSNPYKFETKEFIYTVSIGAVPLPNTNRSADKLISAARMACKIASESEGDSFYIQNINDSPPLLTEIVDNVIASSDIAGIKNKESIKNNIITPRAESIINKASTPEPEIKTGTLITKESKIDEKPSKPQTNNQKKQAPVRAERIRQINKATTDTKNQRPKINAAIPARVSEKIESSSRHVGGAQSKMGHAALILKKAFDENRIVQVFQQSIALSSGDNEGHALYDVSLQLVNIGGTVKNAREINEIVNTPAMRNYIDRWMLREAIGRIINNSDNHHIFIVKLSGDSLSDTTLFNWLRKLLSGLDNRSPGRFIALEISSDDLSGRQKQAKALIQYLRKSHGFKFVINYTNELNMIEQLTKDMGFDLIRINYELLSQLEGDNTMLNDLQSNGAKIIVDNIIDAASLTTAISYAANYAIGDFIGETTSQPDETDNIESFEII